MRSACRVSACSCAATATAVNGQTVLAQTTSGTPVTVGDTLTPVGRWDLGAIEVVPASKVNVVSTTAPVVGSGAVSATVSPTNNYWRLTQGDLLVATVSTVNSAAVTVSSPDHPEITFTRAFDQGDTIAGDGGRVSVWEAEIPVNDWVGSMTVTSSISGNGSWSQTLTVQELNGAAGIGATAFANGPRTSTPAVSLTPTQPGSLIGGAGFAADNETTVAAGTNQALDSSTQDTTDLAQMWTQHHLFGTTAGQAVSLSDTLSPVSIWDLAAYEVTPEY